MLLLGAMGFENGLEIGVAHLVLVGGNGLIFVNLAVTGIGERFTCPSSLSDLAFQGSFC